jgi:hypothetical protein
MTGARWFVGKGWLGWAVSRFLNRPKARALQGAGSNAVEVGRQWTRANPYPQLAGATDICDLGLDSGDTAVLEQRTPANVESVVETQEKTAATTPFETMTL